MSELDVQDLAGAVIDGDRIDWTSARARANSARDQSVLLGLQTLSVLSAVDAAQRPDRRLPLVLNAFRVCAIACCAVGLAGLAITGTGPRPVRGAVMAALLVVFTAVAAYLDLAARDRRGRTLGVCFWLCAAAFSARGTIQLALRWPQSVVLRGLVAVRPEALLGAAFWEFARYFPARTIRLSQIDRTCDWGTRVGVGIGLGLFAANLLAFFVPLASVSRLVAPLDRIAGDGPIYWNLVFSVSIAALIVIAHRGRAAIAPERVRVRLFVRGVVFAFAPVMTQVFIEGLFPSYMRLMRTPSGLFWSGLFVYPPLFCLPLVTAYAVTANNVLPARVVIQHGLRYLLTRWLVMWGAVVPLAALLIHLYRHANQPLAITVSKPTARALLWSSAVGLTALACRGWLLQWLDRWTLAGPERPSVLLAAMSEQLKQTRTTSEVTTLFAETVARAMQTDALPYVTVGGRLLPATGASAPPLASAVEVLLQGSREPCVVRPGAGSYYLLMGDEDRRWIDSGRLEVLVPILSGRAGRLLVGIVALRGRRNALAYSDDDLRFLKAAAASASLACDALGSIDAVPSDREELAMACTRCGGIAAWSPDWQTCSCGGELQRAALPNRLLSRFELHQRLGAGGMGVVYRATDLILGREVALKTLPLLSEEAAAQLIAEARTMASLPHSDVAVLYGVERWRGTPVLIMEYLPQGTLASRLRSGALDPPVALEIVTRVGAVVANLHDEGLFHGDIKPSNIGLFEDKPKLLDFGLARAVSADSGDEGQSAIAGTLPYLSPEVRRGTPPDPSLDCWALAVVLCECLLGHHPFSRARSDREIAAGVHDAIARLRGRAPTEVLDTLARALSISRVERISNTRELVRALERAAAVHPRSNNIS